MTSPSITGGTRTPKNGWISAHGFRITDILKYALVHRIYPDIIRPGRPRARGRTRGYCPSKVGRIIELATSVTTLAARPRTGRVLTICDKNLMES